MQSYRAKFLASVLTGVIGATLLPLGARPALAQTSAPQVYIQIEARNALPAAQDRLSYWQRELADVQGLRLASGWYAVVLGPYSQAEALEKLQIMRARGQIPGDSFIPDPRLLRGAFQAPAASATEVRPQPLEPAEAPEVTSPHPTPAPIPTPETITDAQADEARLSSAERMDIQHALSWRGLYETRVDGAFGRGTRTAIGAWQNQQGFEATGVLTPSQRRDLVAGWQAEQAALGLQRVEDPEIGIAIDLPLKLVAFDRYAPPFAQYAARNGSGTEIWLISQAGSQAAFEALYTQLQTHPILPANARGQIGENGFTLSGNDGQSDTRIEVQLREGAIRGYLLSAPAAQGPRNDILWQAMRKSFAPLGRNLLDPSVVALDDTLRRQIATGLQSAQPLRTGSGVWVSAQGQVLTAASTVEGCRAVTLQGHIPAQVLASDSRLGYALLAPLQALAPQGVAKLTTAPAHAKAPIAAAGFNFGLQMPRPSLIFGTHEGSLEGAPQRNRLGLKTLGGEIGAPVMGLDGLVFGILQAPQEGRQTMAPLAPILQDLATKSHSLPVETPNGGEMALEDLTILGTAMAAQIACWP